MKFTLVALLAAAATAAPVAQRRGGYRYAPFPIPGDKL